MDNDIKPSDMTDLIKLRSKSIVSNKENEKKYYIQQLKNIKPSAYLNELGNKIKDFVSVISFTKKEMLSRYSKTSAEYIELSKAIKDMEEIKQIYYRYWNEELYNMKNYTDD